MLTSPKSISKCKLLKGVLLSTFLIHFIFVIHLLGSTAFAETAGADTSPKTNAELGSVQACIDQTRWHHDGALHVQYIEIEEAWKVCKQAAIAENANEDVTFGIARLHYNDSEYDKARVILERLLEAGYANAGELLANFYFYGDGVEKSYRKFTELAQRAYDLGSISAGNQLHHAYYWGYGVMADDKLALQYLEEAAKKGDSRSKIELAQALTHGYLGFEINYQRAKSLIVGELKSGNVDAEIHLQVIRTLEPRDLAELIEAQQSLIRLSDEGHEGAMYALLKLETSEYWYEDIGKKYSYEQNADLAAIYGLKLLDTGYGLSRFNDLVYSDHFGKSLSTEQMEPIVERLTVVANNPIEIDIRSSILACDTLSEIYEKGLAGPANEAKAIEFLRLAGEQYKDGESANYASWLIFTSDKFFDLDEALRLGHLSLSSENPYVRANGHNNVGVYYHYSSDPKSLELAKKHFHKSAELFTAQDYIWSQPYDNLARLYLFNLPNMKANVVEAKSWARLSDENEGNGFLSYLIAKYPFKNDTSIEQALTWLEKEAQSKNQPAYMELAFIHEILKNDREIVKWYTLCSVMCSGDDRQRSEQELIKKKKITKGIVYAEGKDAATEWLANSLKPITVKPADFATNEVPKVRQNGQLYAFLVGINRYQKYENLETPLRDIFRIGEVLEKKFAARSIYLEDATRREITTELNQLRKVLTQDDTVLVYYAGHGLLDPDTDEGYWLPSDADPDDDTNWVSNNYVLNKLKAFPATNVMLVADSCFSGSIISRGVSIPTVNNTKTVLQKYLDTPSRIAITSGGLKPVLDGGGNGNSLFAAAFAEALEKANQPITSAEIYLNVRDNVTRKSLALNVDQTPLRGEIIKAGHEGPDFILIPR